MAREPELDDLRTFRSAPDIRCLPLIIGPKPPPDFQAPSLRSEEGVLWPDVPGRSIFGAVPGTWQDLEAGAPELARLGVARLQAARVALLGTLRRDRSPRISPVEPYIVAGHLLAGAMAWSRKAADLQRDPRYVLHSAVTGPDDGEGELKVYGSAVEAGQDLGDAAAGAWWTTWPAGKAVVFSLRIEQAAFIEWDVGHGWMTTHRWSPAGGYSQARRAYP